MMLTLCLLALQDADAVRSVEKGVRCAVDKASARVARDEESWEKLWESSFSAVPKPKLPKVDFEKDVVVAYFRGSVFPCDEVEIKKAAASKEKLVVTVQIVKPKPPEGAGIQIMFQPYHFVAVKKSLLKDVKKIVFVDKKTEKELDTIDLEK